MKRILMMPAIAGLALMLSGCGAMLGGLTGLGAAAPPAQVQHVAQLARGPLDFAEHSFDGALYAFDLAMDLKKPAPGTPQAKAIAAAGRKVLAALGAAETAVDVGSSATYDEAFRKANGALDQFRQLLGVPSATAMLEPPGTRIHPILTRGDREAVLARANSPDSMAIAALLGGN